MKMNLETTVTVGLVAISIAFAIITIWISSTRELTPLETTLLQVVSLGVGLYGSYRFGRSSAAESVRETARLHARHAFRRVLELNDGLYSLSERIRRIRRIRPSVELAVIQAIVDEQVAFGLSAIEDWRDIIPEDVDELLE